MKNSMNNRDVSDAIWEIRDLLRVLAEPAIAQRDEKRRMGLRALVGSSKPKARSILLMDGTRSQSAILKESGIAASHLSTLVKQLGEADLLSGDPKLPKLAIVIPETFFEKEA